MILLDYETDNGKRGLGDVIISTPIIEALSRKYDQRIDIILREEAQPLLLNNPFVRNLYQDASNLNPDLHLVMGMKVEEYINIRNCQPRIDSMAELFGVELNSKIPQIYYPKLDKVPNSIGVSIESTSNVRRWRYDYLVDLMGLMPVEWYVFGLTSVELPEHTHNYLGKLDLGRTIELVSQMERFFTVDSFYSHLTAALNIPTVILYTTIPSEWRMKYYPNAKAIQSPKDCSPCLDRQDIKIKCDGKCVDMITVDMIQHIL